eukprot:16016-Heterococcus_DN1.PRE.2
MQRTGLLTPPMLMITELIPAEHLTCCSAQTTTTMAAYEALNNESSNDTAVCQSYAHYITAHECAVGSRLQHELAYHRHARLLINACAALRTV